MKTTSQCIDDIVETLNKSGAKRIKKEDHESLGYVFFTMKKLNFSITVEEEDIVSYSVEGIHGREEEFGEKFAQTNTIAGDLKYLEEFINDIQEGKWDHITAAWSAFDKLKEKFDSDQLGKLAALYFDL